MRRWRGPGWEGKSRKQPGSNLEAGGAQAREAGPAPPRSRHTPSSLRPGITLVLPATRTGLMQSQCPSCVTGIDDSFGASPTHLREHLPPAGRSCGRNGAGARLARGNGRESTRPALQKTSSSGHQLPSLRREDQGGGRLSVRPSLHPKSPGAAELRGHTLGTGCVPPPGLSCSSLPLQRGCCAVTLPPLRAATSVFRGAASSQSRTEECGGHVVKARSAGPAGTDFLPHGPTVDPGVTVKAAV